MSIAQVIVVVLTSLGTLTAATVGITMWTLRTWPEPFLPTLYLASVLFGLFVIFGVGWFIVTSRDLEESTSSAAAERRGFRRLIILVGNVALATGSLAIVASWNVSGVRALFVDTLATHVSLEKPMRDPSASVRLKACKAFFARGWVYRSKAALVAALDGDPVVATSCLTQADEAGWKGVPMIASSLNNGWTASMMRTSSEQASRACEIVPWSPGMSKLAEQPPAPRLLHCLLEARAEEVRKCCAETIEKNGGFLALVGEPEAVEAAAAEKFYDPLVAHAFGAKTLDETSRSVVTTLKLDDEGVREWTLELGCGLLDPSTSQPELLRGLMQLVESDACALTDEQALEHSKPTAWLRLCRHASSPDRVAPVQERICAGVSAARTLETIQQAQLRVHEAVRAPFLRRQASFVEDGIRAAAQGGGSGGATDKELARQQQRASDVVTGMRTLHNSPTCEKTSYALTATGAQWGDRIRYKSNIQFCDRYREDMTVAEYEAANEMVRRGNESAADTAKGLRDGSLVREKLRRR